MRVLVNAGPWLPVPPLGYGGIENVVATLVPELRRLGFDVLPSSANFVFAGHPQAETIFRKLRERGILVRYFKKPRIDRFLRISIGTDEQMDALLQALSEILES